MIGMLAKDGKIDFVEFLNGLTNPPVDADPLQSFAKTQVYFPSFVAAAADVLLNEPVLSPEGVQNLVAGVKPIIDGAKDVSLNHCYRSIDL